MSQVTAPTMLAIEGERVVAYWFSPESPLAEHTAAIFKAIFPEARRYFDYEVMARIYGLSPEELSGLAT